MQCNIALMGIFVSHALFVFADVFASEGIYMDVHVCVGREQFGINLPNM